MRIAILSDTRLPTLPYGGHGLGRLAIDLCHELRQRHDVTLYAAPGSVYDGPLITHHDERSRPYSLNRSDADVWIDISHFHDLSIIRPDWPVINKIADKECPYQPPNATVGTEHMLSVYPGATVLHLGIRAAEIPFYAAHDDYLVFCAKREHRKGFDLALEFAARSPLPVHFAGPGRWAAPNDHGEILNNQKLYKFVGKAAGHLAPYRNCAGGRSLLEAAAAGTPTLCLEGTGTVNHVGHGISGFICTDVDDMLARVPDVMNLNREAVRQWVLDNHDMAHGARALEQICAHVAQGQTV